MAAAATEVRPVLLRHKDYMAIRGLVHRLREQRLVEAANSIERISNGYEAGEHLAVVDRATLLAHEARPVAHGTPKKKRRHGRQRGR